MKYSISKEGWTYTLNVDIRGGKATAYVERSGVETVNAMPRSIELAPEALQALAVNGVEVDGVTLFDAGGPSAPRDQVLFEAELADDDRRIQAAIAALWARGMEVRPGDLRPFDTRSLQQLTRGRAEGEYYTSEGEQVPPEYVGMASRCTRYIPGLDRLRAMGYEVRAL